jgi:hypothetical protein
MFMMFHAYQWCESFFFSDLPLSSFYSYTFPAAMESAPLYSRAADGSIKQNKFPYQVDGATPFQSRSLAPLLT